MKQRIRIGERDAKIAMPSYLTLFRLEYLELRDMYENPDLILETGAEFEVLVAQNDTSNINNDHNDANNYDDVNNGD